MAAPTSFTTPNTTSASTTAHSASRTLGGMPCQPFFRGAGLRGAGFWGAPLRGACRFAGRWADGRRVEPFTGARLWAAAWTGALLF